MPVKCFVKPNRTRTRNFSARDAARVMCYAIEQGATRQQIVNLSIEICPVRGGRISADAVAVAVSQAQIDEVQNDLQESIEEIRTMQNQMLLISGILVGLIATLTAIGFIVRPLRLVATGLGRLQSVAAQVTVSLGRTAAANDKAYNVIAALRRAA